MWESRENIWRVAEIVATRPISGTLVTEKFRVIEKRHTCTDVTNNSDVKIKMWDEIRGNAAYVCKLCPADSIQQTGASVGGRLVQTY